MRPTVRRGWTMVGLAWTLWLFAIAMGEQVPTNDGLGWDGVRFARYATRGPEALLKREVNSYYVQRMGPSLVVHGIIRAAGQPFDSVTIRWTFLGMNLILLTGSIVMLVDIGRRLALSAFAQWLLFIGLFLNPANGRLPVYYATIGDSTAFALGMAMLWGWCARKSWALVLASLIALVSWPAAFYLLLPLILWPRSADTGRDAPSRSKPLDWKWAVIALPVGGLLMAASWRIAEMSEVPAWDASSTVSLCVNAWLFGLAVIAPLLQVDRTLARDFAAGISMKNVGIALALFLAGRAFVAASTSGSLSFSEVTYWREVLLYVQARPFAPVVGHVAYFGALAGLTYVMWPRVLAVARGLGPGPLGALALMGVQALDTESRRLSANWPLVGLCTVIALEPWLRDRRVLAAITATCLLFSKLWWRWSGSNLFPAAYEPGNYYNLQGPSLSDEAFMVHLAAIAILTTIAALMITRKPSLQSDGAALPRS